MAFRFPETAEQSWGMNMYRTMRRSREESVWNPMDPTQKLLNQGGLLRGITNIRSAFAAQPLPVPQRLWHSQLRIKFPHRTMEEWI